MRERLIELLLESEPIKERDMDDDWLDGEIADIADYLLANGVVVLPCKCNECSHRCESTNVQQVRRILERRRFLQQRQN